MIRRSGAHSFFVVACIEPRHGALPRDRIHFVAKTCQRRAHFGVNMGKMRRREIARARDANAQRELRLGARICLLIRLSQEHTASNDLASTVCATARLLKQADAANSDAKLQHSATMLLPAIDSNSRCRSCERLRLRCVSGGCHAEVQLDGARGRGPFVWLRLNDGAAIDYGQSDIL